MSEIAICYEPERLLPKKKKPIIQMGSVRSTFYVSRSTRFNFDHIGIRERGDRPFSDKRRRPIL